MPIGGGGIIPADSKKARVLGFRDQGPGLGVPFAPSPSQRSQGSSITFSLMQAIDPRAHRRTSQVLILMEGKSRDLAGHLNWPGKTTPIALFSAF